MTFTNYLNQVTPYVPSERSNCATDCNLDWNEGFANTSPILAELKQALTLNDIPLNLYSDPDYRTLHEAAREFYLPRSCSYAQVLSFPGSDAGIAAVARAFIGPGDLVLVPVPSYDNAILEFDAQGANLEFYDFFCENQFGDFLEVAKLSKPKLIYLVNPNNPIGYSIGPDKIRDLAKAMPNCIILLDEAYIEFSSNKSCIDAIKDCENLVITRTMSKAFSLASIRVGWLISSPVVAGVVAKIRNSKCISRISELIASSALKHYGYMAEFVREIELQRASILQLFDVLKLKHYKSDANFVLFCDETGGIQRRLAGAGLSFRDRSKQMMSPGWCRLTLNPRVDLPEIIKNS